ncbi:MAG TPA: DUF4382 domain-containing protein [Puia sp.]|nr:DUF4382 domain-containing protein [Puia sp.]
MKLSSFLLLAGVLSLPLLSCNKTASSGGSRAAYLQVMLTDGPATYDAVYIDIRQVEVNASADSNASDSGAASGWQTVPLVRPGVYNLLDFRNGVDTILAAADLPAGKLSQVRLILGDSNSVVTAGQSYPMKTPSAQESGLKLNFDATLTAGIDYKLWIDFDASRSIVETGNGKFILKPVLRAYSEAIGGSIKGFALPGSAMPEVWAIQGADTMLALADTTTGYYFFGGVNPGSWNLLFQPRDTTFADTSAMVNVSTGIVTDAGTMTLRPK